jgi:hypothetical protein
MQVDLRQGVVAALDVADAVGDVVASDLEGVVAAGAGASVGVGDSDLLIAKTNPMLDSLNRSRWGETLSSRSSRWREELRKAFDSLVTVLEDDSYPRDGSNWQALTTLVRPGVTLGGRRQLALSHSKNRRNARAFGVLLRSETDSPLSHIQHARFLGHSSYKGNEQ